MVDKQIDLFSYMMVFCELKPKYYNNRKLVWKIHLPENMLTLNNITQNSIKLNMFKSRCLFSYAYSFDFVEK